MKGTVTIDCFPENAWKYVNDHAIIVVDVIRSTTTATTAVSMGKRVFPARTTDEAYVIAGKLENPIMAGELGGNIPYGFELNNSPVQMEGLADDMRPIVLVSSSGTQLILNSAGAPAVYLACFRNMSAVARHVSGRHERIAILGAGTRGQFRREDQMGCAWVADRLIKDGYRAQDAETTCYIARWDGKGPDEIKEGKSAQYLMKSGQERDLDYVLSHIDDTCCVPSLSNGELVANHAEPANSANSRKALS